MRWDTSRVKQLEQNMGQKEKKKDETAINWWLLAAPERGKPALLKNRSACRDIAKQEVWVKVRVSEGPEPPDVHPVHPTAAESKEAR